MTCYILYSVLQCQVLPDPIKLTFFTCTPCHCIFLSFYRICVKMLVVMKQLKSQYFNEMLHTGDNLHIQDQRHPGWHKNENILT